MCIHICRYSCFRMPVGKAAVSAFPGFLGQRLHVCRWHGTSSGCVGSLEAFLMKSTASHGICRKALHSFRFGMNPNFAELQAVTISYRSSVISSNIGFVFVLWYHGAMAIDIHVVLPSGRSYCVGIAGCATVSALKTRAQRGAGSDLWSNISKDIYSKGFYNRNTMKHHETMKCNKLCDIMRHGKWAPFCCDRPESSIVWLGHS